MISNTEIFKRSISLLGEESIKKLENSKVIIFGVGGVGSFAAETLVRSGISNIVLVDYDHIDLSNVNRQIQALNSTVGRYKVDVLRDRFKDINPNIKIEVHTLKVDENTIGYFNFNDYDYVIDAIDMIKSKIEIIKKAKAENIKVISSMGFANKLDPCRIKVGMLSKTFQDPIAKILRREINKKGFGDLKVVWSDEVQKETSDGILGTYMPVPATAGLILSSEVIQDLI